MATRKLFTVVKANRALPLVSRIVKDITEKHQAYRTLLARLPQTQEEGERDTVDAEITRLEGQLESHALELRAIGVELKDVETGLVDFRAERAGEPIYLCWKLGEPAVAHWHPLQSGFAGRRPVSELPAETLGS
ncbi:MAG: DUF2203 domain-containing protein [Planctomycetota bacterium]